MSSGAARSDDPPISNDLPTPDDLPTSDDLPTPDDLPVTVHGLRAAPGDAALDRFLRGPRQLAGGLVPVVGPSALLVHALSGPPDALREASAGLGAGPATAEAAAVRLARQGVAAAPGEPAREVDRRALVALCREHGRDAVRVLREDPGLVTQTWAGGWWAAGWRTRLVRRLALAGGPAPLRTPPRVLADVAFWQGVEEAATAQEWARLTRSSYVVLCYHRLAGLAKPGQERMDVAPAALARQLGVLRVLGFRPLAPDELLAFHRDPAGVLPRRRYVVTADDGFDEAVDVLTRHAARAPQVFAVTRSVAGRSTWLGDEPLAGWDDLDRLRAAGGVVGSHARRHVPLDELTDDELAGELAGSREDLRAALPGPAGPDLLAYPHGRHDRRVVAAARAAGYAAAYTTAQGRNGAGTDPWCLRRVEPKAWDTTASFLWKVLTGESPPRRWERRLERRWRRGRAPDQPSA